LLYFKNEFLILRALEDKEQAKTKGCMIICDHR